MRWLRPLSLVVTLLVIARAFRGTPVPSGHGAGLGVSVALAAIAVGAAGVLATYRVPGGSSWPAARCSWLARPPCSGSSRAGPACSARWWRWA